MAGLVVQNFRVRSLSIESLSIFWEIEPTAEDVLDYRFQLSRSESPEGPYSVISPELTDAYMFVDNRVMVGHKFRKYFYKLSVRNLLTGSSAEFGPVSQDAQPDLIAEEVRRHAGLLMREFVGRRCWVLPARTFGTRCAHCWDFDLKKSIKSNCRSCFDTSFFRGYLPPIESFVQIDPSPKVSQETNVGRIQPANTTARLSYFPPLKVDDLIIEPENIRWRVTQVSSTQRLRAVLHQEVQLHQINKPDIAYAVDFNFGTQTLKTPDGEVQEPIRLEDLELAGSRNFTNPQNLEGFENEEIPSIFNLYPSTYPRQ
jgi:hypothetical protein